jgi:protein TonB
MYTGQPPRAIAAASSAALTALVFGVLVFGLNAAMVVSKAPALVAITFEAQPPPALPKPRQRPVRHNATKAAPKDDAGRRNLRNIATPVVAPPVVPLIVPPPVIAAPIANIGAAPKTGASDRLGPGAGAGRYGNGRGGGGTGGDGDGDGDGGAVEGPRRKSGRIAYSDLPEDALAIGDEAPVVVIYAVEPDGSADRCRIDHSSGHPAIDSLTCRLIEQRFRFRPALDRNGRPVRSMIRETHTWVANDR